MKTVGKVILALVILGAVGAAVANQLPKIERSR